MQTRNRAQTLAEPTPPPPGSFGVSLPTAMALRSPSRTPRRVAGSPPLTSQGGAKADAARKMEEEVERLLANLEKEGVEIDDKIASIIDDEVARIEAEVVRKNKDNELNRAAMIMGMLSFAFASVGALHGMNRCEEFFYQAVATNFVFGVLPCIIKEKLQSTSPLQERQEKKNGKY